LLARGVDAMRGFLECGDCSMWLWAAFILFILFLLALDLGVTRA
jgi:hypothetical protein